MTKPTKSYETKDAKPKLIVMFCIGLAMLLIGSFIAMKVCRAPLVA